MKRIRHYRDHDLPFSQFRDHQHVDHVITIIKIQRTKYSRNYENFIVKMTIDIVQAPPGAAYV
jgi:hypothetical protein